MASDAETFPNNGNRNLDTNNESDYKLQIFQSSLNVLAHVLIGASVMSSLLFAFRSGLPLNATSLHIVLCVIGYHLLMAQAILSLSDSNGWSSKLRLVDRRRAHWILQILGSGLAIIGSFIKIVDKSAHWNTLHGKFALVALVFTTFSLVNGVASLYGVEWRRFLNMNISKLTHVCFGIVAFSSATITLCYGFDKFPFRTWASTPVADALIAVTAVYATIIIINPAITFYRKSRVVIKNATS
ncbi:hypothetical protein JYU34_013581 [Plutella xylostella]|uniref:ascorbate ferrireductase (transmembrane) n=1 Tax=Plutella xylostella TaxID=51655 RepID=A0ABQ7QAJ3_PLUXY|nr:hypothetical protein JYU34_013581 [Plutella xylostella]